MLIILNFLNFPNLPLISYLFHFSFSPFLFLFPSFLFLFFFFLSLFSFLFPSLSPFSFLFPSSSPSQFLSSFLLLSLPRLLPSSPSLGSLSTRRHGDKQGGRQRLTDGGDDGAWRGTARRLRGGGAEALCDGEAAWRRRRGGVVEERR